MWRGNGVGNFPGGLFRARRVLRLGGYVIESDGVGRVFLWVRLIRYPEIPRLLCAYREPDFVFGLSITAHNQPSLERHNSCSAVADFPYENVASGKSLVQLKFH